MLDRYHGWAVGSAGGVYAYRPVTGVVERLREFPERFSLRQNYPNPFNSRTTIEYELKAPSHVTLVVFDVGGRKVASLVDKNQEAGVYRVGFDASALASGSYYYTIQTDSFSDTRSMVLMK